jgi:UDP-glucose 4-epimerase
MKILITGAGGYLAGHMIQEALAMGHEVRALARTPSPQTEMLAASLNVHFADITQALDPHLFENTEVCIHLAAANDVDSQDATTALMATTLGTRNVLEACRLANVKKCIYFSTFQVYGWQRGYMDESAALLPLNDYGITHLFAEEYVALYKRKFDIDYLILRPANIYGAPLHAHTDRWSLVPNCFVKEAARYGTITLGSSGKQLRDFMSAQWVAKATLEALKQFSVLKNQPHNLGSGNGLSILDTAMRVKEIYEARTSKSCTLHVRSEEPLSSEPFSIQPPSWMPPISSESFQHEMEKEIHKSFELLLNLKD